MEKPLRNASLHASPDNICGVRFPGQQVCQSVSAVFALCMREKITPERGLVPGSGVRFDSMGDRNGGGRNYSPTLFPTLFPTSNPPRFIP